MLKIVQKLGTGVATIPDTLNNWVWVNLRPGTGKIYRETEIANNVYERYFPIFTKPKQLKWHMDDEDRLVVCKSYTTWKIQLEDQLPVSLNNPIFIKRHQWHRLIKGNGPLTLKLKKYADGTNII